MNNMPYPSLLNEEVLFMGRHLKFNLCQADFFHASNFDTEE